MSVAAAGSPPRRAARQKDEWGPEAQAFEPVAQVTPAQEMPMPDENDEQPAARPSLELRDACGHAVVPPVERRAGRPLQRMYGNPGPAAVREEAPVKRCIERPVFEPGTRPATLHPTAERRHVDPACEIVVEGRFVPSAEAFDREVEWDGQGLEPPNGFEQAAVEFGVVVDVAEEHDAARQGFPFECRPIGRPCRTGDRGVVHRLVAGESHRRCRPA